MHNIGKSCTSPQLATEQWWAPSDPPRTAYEVTDTGLLRPKQGPCAQQCTAKGCHLAGPSPQDLLSGRTSQQDLLSGRTLPENGLRQPRKSKAPKLCLQCAGCFYLTNTVAVLMEIKDAESVPSIPVCLLPPGWGKDSSGSRETACFSRRCTVPEEKALFPAF